MRNATHSEWEEFARLLDPGAPPNHPILPSGLAYHGAIPTSSGYVPPEEILGALRSWLAEQGESEVFYFLTETSPVQGNNSFRLQTWEVTESALRKLNRAYESVLAGVAYQWAVWIDHNSNIHIAGPEELRRRLEVAASKADSVSDT